MGLLLFDNFFESSNFDRGLSSHFALPSCLTYEK